MTNESKAAGTLLKYLKGALEEAGAELTVCELSFNEILESLYSSGEREYDMYFLGTNFDIVFNPAQSFDPDEAFEIVANITHIKDEELYKLAVDMNANDADDIAGYYTAWYRLQQRFIEVQPLAPIYSDVYTDFYVNTLRDYAINDYEGWAKAIVAARFSYEDE